MTTTVLKLSESSSFLKTISLKTIKDVRALDVDLLLVLTNGDQILISGGAMHALNSPDLALQFSDGQLPLARVFEQIERINVSPEANLSRLLHGMHVQFNIDINWLLTGQHQPFRLNSQEMGLRMLLHHYARADETGKHLLISAASLLAMTERLPKDAPALPPVAEAMDQEEL